MADQRTYAEQSRIGWYRANGGQPTTEQLTFGCLQRIATATEIMSQRHVDLMKERDYYERMYRAQVDLRRHAERRIAALQGVITRMKRKREASNG